MLTGPAVNFRSWIVLIEVIMIMMSLGSDQYLTKCLRVWQMTSCLVACNARDLTCGGASARQFTARHDRAQSTAMGGARKWQGLRFRPSLVPRPHPSLLLEEGGVWARDYFRPKICEWEQVLLAPSIYVSTNCLVYSYRVCHCSLTNTNSIVVT